MTPEKFEEIKKHHYITDEEVEEIKKDVEASKSWAPAKRARYFAALGTLAVALGSAGMPMADVVKKAMKETEVSASHTGFSYEAELNAYNGELEKYNTALGEYNTIFGAYTKSVDDTNVGWKNAVALYNTAFDEYEEAIGAYMAAYTEAEGLRATSTNSQENYVEAMVAYETALNLYGYEYEDDDGETVVVKGAKDAHEAIVTAHSVLVQASVTLSEADTARFNILDGAFTTLEAQYNTLKENFDKLHQHYIFEMMNYKDKQVTWQIQNPNPVHLKRAMDKKELRTFAGNGWGNVAEAQGLLSHSSNNATSTFIRGEDDEGVEWSVSIVSGNNITQQERNTYKLGSKDWIIRAVGNIPIGGVNFNLYYQVGNGNNTQIYQEAFTVHKSGVWQVVNGVTGVKSDSINQVRIGNAFETIPKPVHPTKPAKFNIVAPIQNQFNFDTGEAPELSAPVEPEAPESENPIVARLRGLNQLGNYFKGVSGKSNTGKLAYDFGNPTFFEGVTFDGENHVLKTIKVTTPQTLFIAHGQQDGHNNNYTITRYYLEAGEYDASDLGLSTANADRHFVFAPEYNKGLSDLIGKTVPGVTVENSDKYPQP